ncbi:MAG: OsmC family protein [Euryarchaeota archaeon]|nr:OsmC family protein [Euryarchaeota archaeon]
MKRTAQAVWQGTLKEGKGTLSTESGALKTVNYAFTNRFENTPGTNPEELVAAAHAGCFSMAFSNNLATAGFKPERIETSCAITFEKDANGWAIRESALTVKAKVPGATKAQVEENAQKAKTGCPISRALNPSINVTLNLTVEGTGGNGTARTPTATTPGRR